MRMKLSDLKRIIKEEVENAMGSSEVPETHKCEVEGCEGPVTWESWMGPPRHHQYTVTGDCDACGERQHKIVGSEDEANSLAPLQVFKAR